MGRAPTTSRVLLALGALTLAVLAGSLLTGTGTAAAHEAETPPNPNFVGEEEGPCTGAAETAYGEADAPTLDDNEKCTEGKSKEKWYHQNYWYPCVGTSTTNCVRDKTVDDVEGRGDKWHLFALRHFTSSALNLPDRTTPTLTDYLNKVETKHPSWQRSWCGVGNVSGRNAKPFDTWKEAKDANCGHTGNRPHGYFNHQPTKVIVRTRTVYVDTHNHCDDDTHPSDHDNDTCPEDVEVCELEPLTPVLREEEDADENDAVTTVSWTADASGVPCTITQQQLRVTLPNGTSTTRPVSFNPLVTTASVRDATEGVTPVKVEVRVRNEARDLSARPPIDGWSDWGVLWLTWTAPDDVCDAPPSTPVLTRGADLPNGRTTVSWEVADDGDGKGELCDITAQQLRYRISGQRWTTPPVGVDDKNHDVPTPAQGFTPVTVEVRVQNNNVNTADRWSDWGQLDLHWTPPATVCPLPAAPTVTKHGFRTRGGVEEQEVRWEVDDPAGVGCEVTGWHIYYGTDAARETDRHETSSWERKPAPGSRIRVFVRAENHVRPGSTAKQLGNSGDVDLYGDCPAGTTHAGKPMDDPAVGGTVEGCNDDDDGCAVPDAPVLLGPDSGTGYLQVVTWTVADPAGVGCEITGQELRVVPQRGISSTSDRDENTRESTQSVTDRTGAVVVSVRAKNRVQPGGTDQQRGGLDTVKLDGQPHQTVSV